MSLLAGLSQQGDSISAHTQAWSTITNTPTTLSGYGITDAQPLDSDLTALAGLSANGLVVRAGSGTAAVRTITGTTNQVIVTNGDGVNGNPTLSLPQSIATTSSPTFAGLVAGSISATGPIVSTVIDSFRTNHDSGYISFYDSAQTMRTGYIQGNVGLSMVMASENGAGIGLNTSGSTRLTVTTDGVIRFNAYGAGALVTDSSGNITASSDRRLKNVSGKFTRGLDAILQIQPKVFTWKPESGMNTDDVNVGFIAQDVQPAIPEAVGSMKTVDTEEDDGTGKKVKKSKREASEYLTLSDRPIIATLVNAVKELSEQNAALVKRIAALEMAKK